MSLLSLYLAAEVAISALHIDSLIVTDIKTNINETDNG